MARLRSLLLCVLFCLAVAPASASAASRFVIRGAGFGHGVGMSQFGAYGYALHGVGYREILAHYYTGTGIGTTDSAREVRVLLQSPRGSASFTGATRAGNRRLTASKTYFVRRHDGEFVELLSPSHRRLATFGAPLRVTGPGPLTLRGRAGNGRVNGSYRGALQFLPGTFGGINVVNAVNLDDYVQGVVPAESPASWPLDALKAQAVAARTYAITTSRGGGAFDQYPDTRSQVYAGVAGEQPSSNQAVAETRGEVVTYQGQPVVTYFFSTSGGQTENVENTPLGNAPKPWLKSVDDPYDDVSPKHRWGPIRMSLTGAGRKLRGLVKGKFRGVKVVQRGASPRVMAADIVGSRGATRVNGATLRARLGLFDTWAYFTSISSEDTPPPDDEPPAEETDPLTGGVQPSMFQSLLPRPTSHGGLRGQILPAVRGEALTIERLGPQGWVAAGTTRVGRGGRYRATVAAAGTYRVRSGDVTGPSVRVR
jgi:stage II sporulation protein D